jgi:hypothetical protein
MAESILIFGNEQANQTLVDPISSAILSNASSGSVTALVSNTLLGLVASTMNHQNLNNARAISKISVTKQIFIFDATSLITAP